MVTTRGEGEWSEGEGKGEINGNGGDMTWGGDIALYLKKKTCISNELKGGLETGNRIDRRTLQ